MTKVLMVLLLTSIIGSAAQVSSNQIDAIFSGFTGAREPGCVVLVVKDGKAVFRKGYGMADLRTWQTLTPETNFRLASLSKQFTAMAIMLLVHDGKLRYENRLTDIFPDFPAYGKTITIRQLLNHTSGLLDYEVLMEKEHWRGRSEADWQISDAGALQLLKHQASTKFSPGSHWDYSNSGYVVLGLVVAKVSGMSFGDFLHQRIFTPLGMDHTVAYEKGRNEVANRAYGHSQVNGTWQETDQSPTSATLGDGGIYTSLDDLEKWDRALTHNELLSAKEMAPAFEAPTVHGAPLQKPDGSLALRYGFGWFLDPYRGHRRCWHYGETVGFRTSIQRFPDERLTVVVLANRAEADAPALALKVADLYLGH